MNSTQFGLFAVMVVNRCGRFVYVTGFASAADAEVVATTKRENGFRAEVVPI